MKKVPILIQLIGILFILLVIPASIVTYYTGSRMITNSTEEIATSTMEKNQTSKELNEIMLQNIIQDTLQVVGGEVVKKYHNIKTYEELNKTYENVSDALSLCNSISDIATKNDSVYSVAFYIDDADYVISSNKGIVQLSNYEDLSWLEEAKSQIYGAEGIWYPRVLSKHALTESPDSPSKNKEINVMSYVYRLSRLATSTKGTIIINVYEDKISNYINSSMGAEMSNSYLIDHTGTILSHQDKSKLYTRISKELTSNLAGHKGTYTTVEDGNTYLNAYIKSDFYDWTYISSYSLSHLMESTNRVWQQSILLTIVVIIVGSILTILFATAFSKPMRQLVKELQQNVGIAAEKNGNELDFIHNAFNEIQMKQQEYHKLIKQHENETKRMLLHDLVEGTTLSELAKKEVGDIFKYSHFMVAMIAVDNSVEYVSATTHEERQYHRYGIYKIIQDTFTEGYIIQCIRYSSSRIAVIFNIEHYDSAVVRKSLEKGLQIVSKKGTEILNTTVTIGIGQVHTGYKNISQCAFEANQAVNQRLTLGEHRIIFWSPKQTENYVYYSFYNIEKKIINYLDTKDLLSLEKELNVLVEQIKQVDNMSNDNILMIFYQLIGSTIKYMVDHNINTSKIMARKESIYSIIAELDTIDAMKGYLHEVFRIIINYLSNETDENEIDYTEHFMNYLKEHYKEEISFEELAAKIGISYSYLRKIVRENTGKSLLDNVNSIRIEEVKRLLLYTDLTLADIAEEVGYNNTQSMCRYFKKYEGINPSEFKLAKQ